MAAYLHPMVSDSGLITITNKANVLYICSAQPTTYTEATSTFALGSKSGLGVSIPFSGTPNGRSVTVSGVSGGIITASGTAGFYAVVGTAGNDLLAAYSLSGTQQVSVGNSFTLSSIIINQPIPS